MTKHRVALLLLPCWLLSRAEEQHLEPGSNRSSAIYQPYNPWRVIWSPYACFLTWKMGVVRITWVMWTKCPHTARGRGSAQCMGAVSASTLLSLLSPQTAHTSRPWLGAYEAACAVFSLPEPLLGFKFAYSFDSEAAPFLPTLHHQVRTPAQSARSGTQTRWRGRHSAALKESEAWWTSSRNLHSYTKHSVPSWILVTPGPWGFLAFLVPLWPTSTRRVLFAKFSAPSAPVTPNLGWGHGNTTWHTGAGTTSSTCLGSPRPVAGASQGWHQPLTPACWVSDCEWWKSHLPAFSQDPVLGANLNGGSINLFLSQ